MYTVAADLFRISTAAQLAEALVTGTIANRSAIRRLLHRSRRAGRAVLGVAEQSAEIKIEEDVEIAFRPELAARDPDKYLTSALELPNRIARIDGKHVIVFFDEFQELVNPRKPYGDPGRLTKRFAADGWDADGDALERLIELGELHSRATMLIAQKTHLVSIMLDTRSVDLALVTQGLALALEGDAAVNEQAVERIRRAHKLGLVVARRIALGTSPTGSSTTARLTGP
ncbi:MAG: hypothetical protein ACRDNE_16190 [Gaiellaceae bacterium]